MVAREDVREQGVRQKSSRVALATVLSLAVAGCRARETVQRTASAPPPQSHGPVNPDARVTVYACVDGQTITAGYPDAQTAVVTYKGHAYTLRRVPSARGQRYVGYGLQWETRGVRATIAALEPGQEAAVGPGLDCVAQGEPAAAALTRTRYAS